MPPKLSQAQQPSTAARYKAPPTAETKRDPNSPQSGTYEGDYKRPSLTNSPSQDQQ